MRSYKLIWSYSITELHVNVHCTMNFKWRRIPSCVCGVVWRQGGMCISWLFTGMHTTECYVEHQVGIYTGIEAVDSGLIVWELAQCAIHTLID